MHGKVIQFNQSHSEQLFESCSVALTGVVMVFPSMEKCVPNLRFTDNVTIIALDSKELKLSFNVLSVAVFIPVFRGTLQKR